MKSGLFDRNGREIEEGNILRFDAWGETHEGEVVFQKGCFRILEKKENGDIAEWHLSSITEQYHSIII